MQTTGVLAQPTAKSHKSQRKESLPLAERAAFTLAEFAAMFGKQKVWAYKKAYAGKLKVIQSFGVMMVPRSELERINAGAVFYADGTKKPAPKRKETTSR